MLQDLVRQLGKELNVEDFYGISETGTYELFFEDDTCLQLSEVDPFYVFNGIICPLPKNHEAFIQQILSANLFGLGTRQAVIGLSKDGKMLTLSLEIHKIIAYKEFKEKIEDFVAVIDVWRNEALKYQ